jgi:fused signal recognition particle receptor
MEYLIIVIVLVVLALIAGGAMLVRGRRRPGRIAEPPQPPGAPAPPPPRPGQDAETVAAPAPGSLATEAPAAEVAEAPQPFAGRMTRLRGRLARSQSGFGAVLLGLLSRDGLDDQGWEEIEDTLVGADLGAGPAAQIVNELRTQVRVGGARGTTEVRSLLRKDLIEQVGVEMDRSLRVARHGDRPAVVLMVGVNGTGKTSTCGKLARALIGEGRTVLLGAADTFRAAGVEQLEVWAQRAGVQFVKGPPNADPGAVAYDAIAAGRRDGADVVIIDTAGRLHTQDDLMAELAKVRRVISNQIPDAPHETLLTVDATTGQNGLRQAKMFSEAIDVSGLVLTKLDGTAKGGIALAIAHDLGIPVKLIGVGEQLEDLRPFDPTDFARALVT